MLTGYPAAGLMRDVEQTAGEIVGTAAALFLFNWGFTGVMLVIGAHARRLWFIIAGALITVAVDSGLAALDSSLFLVPAWLRAAGQFLAALVGGGIGWLLALGWRRLRGGGDHPVVEKAEPNR